MAERNFSGTLKNVLLGVVFLDGLWVAIPVVRSMRRVCPVRPGGIARAEAIPAFARKYSYSCNACHSPSFPKLSDFGVVFRDKGYQVSKNSDLPISRDMEAGYWPITFRTIVGYQTAGARSKDQPADSAGMGFSGLDVLSFGIIDKDFSFGVVYTPGLNSSGFGAAPSGSESDLETAFVRLSNLQRFLEFHPGSYLLNASIRKIEVDLPFSEHRSPTLNTDYVAYHYQPGTPYTGTFSDYPVGPGYENPDDFGLGDKHSGAEVFGTKRISPLKGRLRYSLAALSNSDVNTANTGGGKQYSYYGHLTQSVGGEGAVMGQRVGVFGVFGKVPTTAHPVTPQAPSTGRGAKPFQRAGVDLSLTWREEFNFFGAWMAAQDSKDLFSSVGIVNAQTARWTGGFAQLDWTPSLLPLLGTPGWFFSYRYDAVRNERQGDPGFLKNYNDVDSQTGMARYNFLMTPRGGMSLHFEYNRMRTRNVATDGGDLRSHSFLAGVDLAY